MMHTKTFSNCAYLWLVLLAVLPGCWSESGDKGPKQGLFVVNVLDKKQYDDCHIAGSIHVAVNELESFANTLDKENADIVFYCSNYMCSTSAFAAKKFEKLGFNSVSAYEGGTAEWYQMGLPTEGPAQESYLKKVMRAPAHQDSDVKVITADDLAKKMGLSVREEKEEAAA